VDRRRKFRKTPDKFAFLQLERDDGGSVLDVSEGGLRFETFAPVLQSGPVHLWFSLNLRQRIEPWGEVVWTNAAKRCGGLKFLRLSEDSRAQIREWIARPTPRAAPDGDDLRPLFNCQAIHNTPILCLSGQVCQGKNEENSSCLP